MMEASVKYLEAAEYERQMLEMRRALEERDARISSMSRTIDALQDELRLQRAKRFASTSERLRPEGQQELEFDDEVERIIDELKEEDLTTVTYKRRKAKEKRMRTLDDSDLEEVIVDVEIPEHERICKCCSGKLRDMGFDSRSTLEYEPARYWKQTTRTHKYGCPECDKEGRPQKIVRAEAEPALMPGSFASPSVVAHVMAEKFVKHMPLDRQEKAMAYERVYLSKQTMSNWMCECTHLYLLPLYELMHRELVTECEVIHADETPVKILHPKARPGGAPDPKPTSCYMWAYRSGEYYEHKMALYDHQPTRSGECAREFLRGFSDVLQTDGFSGYGKVPGVTHAGCWAHARRYFHDATIAHAKGTPNHQLAIMGLVRCDEVFALERKFAEMKPEERLAARREKTAKVIDSLYSWIAEVTPRVRPSTKLGEALTYLVNQREPLTVFLDDGRVECSNNAAERSIRPVACGRRNWLFSNTMRGAETSATIISIVETAKLNELNPEAYLRFLLETVPSTSLSELPRLLPWGDLVPDWCRAVRR